MLQIIIGIISVFKIFGEEDGVLIMIPTSTAGPLVCNDVRHSRFVFDNEHPHHFATAASGLLGWRSPWDSLDAHANVNRKIHFSKKD